MFGIGPPELLVIFLIILILFGAKRLPELARSLGKSINEFKNATQNIKDELDIDVDNTPSYSRPAAKTGEEEPPSDNKNDSSEHKD